MRLQGDSGGGLEGLPLKLVIVAVILGLSTPIIISNWMSYDREQTIDHLLGELEFLAAQMDQVYSDGNGVGGSRVVKLDLRDGTFAKIEHVEIGSDDPDSVEGMSARWRLKGEGEQVFIPHGGIPARAAGGGAFALAHGQNEVYLEVVKKSDAAFVELSHV